MNTAVVSTTRPLPGWRRKSQRTLYLCQKYWYDASFCLSQFDAKFPYPTARTV